MNENDKPKNSGVALVLLPSKSYREHRPTTTNHHLTVAFLGRYDDPSITSKQLFIFWRAFTKEPRPKLEAQLAGESWFTTPDGWAHVDLIDVPYLPDFRAELQASLEAHDLPISRVHGLLPHITQRYKQSPDPQTMVHTGQRIRFALDKVALWAGDSRFIKELT
jgi:2'-5' RNA ligase